ncbi:hypothetical protein E1301_Tti015830 [Triplophysa tibetana]|uniref:Uncharacterized protein n=1 Tax=Triplophysa tibetana TaxID=1572043 RepID=A0A5A9P2H8_9TELE|nr:hypothetical protein E1301_Tti015830 [Triplophysa tibetana]
MTSFLHSYPCGDLARLTAKYSEDQRKAERQSYNRERQTSVLDHPVITRLTPHTLQGTLTVRYGRNEGPERSLKVAYACCKGAVDNNITEGCYDNCGEICEFRQSDKTAHAHKVCVSQSFSESREGCDIAPSNTYSWMEFKGNIRQSSCRYAHGPSDTAATSRTMFTNKQRTELENSTSISTGLEEVKFRRIYISGRTSRGERPLAVLGAERHTYLVCGDTELTMHLSLNNVNVWRMQWLRGTEPVWDGEVGAEQGLGCQAPSGAVPIPPPPHPSRSPPPHRHSARSSSSQLICGRNYGGVCPKIAARLTLLTILNFGIDLTERKSCPKLTRLVDHYFCDG